MQAHTARLYIGGLPYVAQKGDIENLFSSNNISLKHIDISIDPFTGRNPSYCFVDFHTTEDAQQALTTMQGQIVRGRPVKLNYHTQKKPTQTQRDNRYVYDRWKRSDEAPSRWTQPHQEGRRLYVGGLPMISHQSAVNGFIRHLFRDWPIEAVSKIISPHSSTRNKPGDHYYCFVDLPTAELAAQAAQALNGTGGSHGGAYRIGVATHSYPGKVVREQLDGIYPGHVPVSESLPVRNIDGNWRSMEKLTPEQSISAML